MTTKIYRLRRTDEVRYDETEAMVVAGETESAARSFAGLQATDEGGAIWRSTSTTCEVIGVLLDDSAAQLAALHQDSGFSKPRGTLVGALILRDFKAG